MEFETDRQNIKTDQGIIFQTPSPHQNPDSVILAHFVPNPDSAFFILDNQSENNLDEI